MRTNLRTGRTSRTRANRHLLRAAVETCEPRRLLADATVTGTVFSDANKDGVRQSNEPGLAGVTVYSDVNYNGKRDASEPTAVTNASGFYSLATPVGPNSVATRLLDVPTSQITAPASGMHSGKFTSVYTAGNRNFGVVPATPQPTTVTVSGTVFTDTNVNGRRDAGEPAAPAGATGVFAVYADLNKNGQRDDGEPQGFLDFDDASFTLGGVPAGRTIELRYLYDYGSPAFDGTLYQTTPAGYGADRPLTITTTSAAYQVVDLGFVRLGTVAGDAVYDANGNGQVDPGEAAASGAFWLDLDNDRVRDANEPAVPEVFRDDGGTGPKRATRLAVPYGTYTVAFAPSSAIGAKAVAFRTVTSSTSGPDVIARIAVPTASPQFTTVSGGLFEDSNGNGKRDAGEPVTYGSDAGNFRVYADLNRNGNYDQGEPLSNAVSGPDSTYTITNLPVGSTFDLRFQYGSPAENGMFQTTPGGFVAALTVTTTATPITNADFGFKREGTISVDPRYDVNANGTAEASEPEFNAGGAWLDLDKDGRRDANEPAVPRVLRGPSYSNMSGTYRIAVPFGTYTVAFARDTAVGALAERSVSVTSSSADPFKTPRIAVTVNSPGVSGIAFVDSNGNGQRDNNELPVGGIVFADYNNNGSLDAGEDSIDLVPYEGAGPAYYLPVAANRPFTLRIRPTSSGALDLNTQSYALTLTGTQQVAGKDFAVRLASTATVTGTIFNDANKNGVRDTGEAGVSGYTVYGDLNYNGKWEANEPTATTNASGFYSLAVPVGPNSVAIRLLNVPAAQITAPTSGAHSGKFTSVYTAGNRNFGVTVTTQPTSYAISGSVFNDLDRDGVKDANEGNFFAGGPPMVYADYNGDGLYDWGDEPSVTANSDGTFTLTVKPGTFELRVQNLALPTVSSTSLRGVVQTTASGAALARVNTADAATRTGRQLGAVGASVVRVQPTVAVESFVGASSLTPAQRAELAYRFTSPYTGWRDLNGNGVRDANEPSAQYFYQTEADGSGYWAYSFVIADGESFRVGVARSSAVGATADKVVTGVGSDGESFYAVEVSSNGTAVVGRIFNDPDGDGVFEETPGQPSQFYPFDAVFADYDYDSVRDADEPAASILRFTDYEDSNLFGYFILPVQANRPFALRLLDGSGKADLHQSTPVQSVKVAENTIRGAYDIGYSDQVGVVSGQLRNDLNRDGVAQSNEGGLAGVRMFVDYDGDGAQDANEPSAITDASGYYAIQAKAGTYNIWIAQPNRYELSLKAGGATNITNLVYQTGAAGYSARSATIAAGVQRGGANFTGVAGALAVVAARTPEVDANVKDTFGAGGPAYAWYDIDGDNVRDANEPLTVEDYLGLQLPFDPHYAVDTVVVPAGVASKIAFAPTNTVGTVATASTTLTLPANATASQPVQVVVPNTESGVFGLLFNDANANGIRDQGESTYEFGDARIFADYNNNGVLDAGEPETYPYYDGSFSRDFGNSHFYLKVDPNRSFTLRAVFQTGATQTLAKSYTVATNTITTDANIGLR